MKKNQKNKLLRNLKDKYRLIVHNDSTFEEVLSFKLSRLNVYGLISCFTLVFIGLVYLLISYTPLKYTIPGFPTKEMRTEIEHNALRVDSLLVVVEQKDLFFTKVKNIISGKDFENDKVDTIDTVKYNKTKNIVFGKSKADSLFRVGVEAEEKYNLAVNENSKITNISNIHFFSPIKGNITSDFNLKENHYGIDITGATNSRISAVLSGSVIFAGWTLDTGNVIIIQHGDNLLSMYKHNSELLKKTGAYVMAGEAIALLGNSGEITTGPHLHFELWCNGKALNPTDYITF